MMPRARERAEAGLTAADFLSVGVVTLDARGQVLSLNPAALMLLGEAIVAARDLSPLPLALAQASPGVATPHIHEGRKLSLKSHVLSDGWIVEIAAVEPPSVDHGRDSLTGLCDRRVFRERLSAQLGHRLIMAQPDAG